jgi:hypothetical protein
VEQLGDEGDDRDDRRGDPEKAETRHQRLNGALRRCVRRAGLLRSDLLLKIERGGIRRLFGERVA